MPSKSFVVSPGKPTITSKFSAEPYLFSEQAGWQKYQDFKLYYQSVHWVSSVVEGPDEQAWYEIVDELYDGYIYYVPGWQLRPIAAEEIAPISPDVAFADKIIEVSLEKQVLKGYENGNLVKETLISSGIFTGNSINGYPTVTPKGLHNIQSKMPSKHMGPASAAGLTEDSHPLPGVPWTCFFAEGGYAFHGTYWHNNFGIPMSKGCVNMRNEDAKWLFRWALPLSAHDRVETRGYGTQVRIY